MSKLIQPDFHAEALTLAKKQDCAGVVLLQHLEQAIQYGYELGLRDSTNLLIELNTEISKLRANLR